MTIRPTLVWRCIACGRSPLIAAVATLSCPRCGSRYDQNDAIWEFADGFAPCGFSRSRSEHLLDIEQDHFWFEARDRLLRNRLLGLKRPEDRRLLELGCGSGRVLTTLAKDFAQTTGIEGHIGALEMAVDACPRSTLLHGNVLDTPLSGDQFDWVVAFDVLEHLEPTLFLGEALRLTRPGGRLMLSVPAFPLLWSRADELAGHRCRYQPQGLTGELNAAGWRPLGHTYFQFLLFPLLTVSRLFSRKTPPRLERKPPKIVNRVLRALNLLEVRFSSRLPVPFGSSLIAWAEKPLARHD